MLDRIFSREQYAQKRAEAYASLFKSEYAPSQELNKKQKEVRTTFGRMSAPPIQELNKKQKEVQNAFVRMFDETAEDSGIEKKILKAFSKDAKIKLTDQILEKSPALLATYNLYRSLYIKRKYFYHHKLCYEPIITSESTKESVKEKIFEIKENHPSKWFNNYKIRLKQTDTDYPFDFEIDKNYLQEVVRLFSSSEYKAVEVFFNNSTTRNPTDSLTTSLGILNSHKASLQKIMPKGVEGVDVTSTPIWVGGKLSSLSNLEASLRERPLPERPLSSFAKVFWLSNPVEELVKLARELKHSSSEEKIATKPLFFDQKTEKPLTIKQFRQVVCCIPSQAPQKSAIRQPVINADASTTRLLTTSPANKENTSNQPVQPLLPLSNSQRGFLAPNPNHRGPVASAIKSDRFKSELLVRPSSLIPSLAPNPNPRGSVDSAIKSDRFKSELLVRPSSLRPSSVSKKSVSFSLDHEQLQPSRSHLSTLSKTDTSSSKAAFHYKWGSSGNSDLSPRL